jgi:hypothetical protein
VHAQRERERERERESAASTGTDVHQKDLEKNPTQATKQEKKREKKTSQGREGEVKEDFGEARVSTSS